jgi:hypothetical protein
LTQGHNRLDRKKITFFPLSERENRVSIEEKAVTPESPAEPLSGTNEETIRRAADAVLTARKEYRPVVCSFGAHAIKNGLAPLLIHFIRNNWFTHLATNGAGIIHDWEFAYQGKSSEDVRENARHGRFGIWQETGFFINLAIAVGAYEGIGYGESVGKMVTKDGLDIPEPEILKEEVRKHISCRPEFAAAALDLLNLIQELHIPSGFMKVEHPYSKYGLQGAAYSLGIPFTAHPMFGHDIIYTHPANSGAAIGRTAERDFLTFAHAVSSLEGGVYLSIGSAVMSPMIFEKSLSMGRNLAEKENRKIEDFSIFVVDLSESSWDWKTKGEPPENHPDYYLRFFKTFYRMGGDLHYIREDNRNFLLHLFKKLKAVNPS